MDITSAPRSTGWQFSGFSFPNYTSVPDQLFDELMPRLSGAELKVLLYIIRRTFGFKRSSDDISLSQMVRGIKKKNGEILDQGTGLSKASVARALKSLEQKKIILRQRRSSGKKGDEATSYALNIINRVPVSQNETPPVSKRDTPVSHQRDTQQTVLQQTVLQQQQKVRENIKLSGGDASKKIAAALVDREIEPRVASQLATLYNRQRIQDNIDWFEWKQKNAPTSIKTNPAGLLRRAIEQDYASEGHHQGFQTRQQKAATAAARNKRLAAQQRLIAAQSQRQRAYLQQKQAERTTRLETLRERFHTTAQEQAIWSQVLQALKPRLTATRFNTYLAQSAILSLKKGRAVIAVPNRFIQTWIDDHLSTTIQQTLAGFLKVQPVTLQYQILDALDPKPKKPQTGPNKSPPPES